jgi:hypothetical protein
MLHDTHIEVFDCVSELCRGENAAAIAEQNQSGFHHFRCLSHVLAFLHFRIDAARTVSSRYLIEMRALRF